MNRKKLVVLVCMMLMITSLIFTHNEKVNASNGEIDWWDYEWSYCKKITIDRDFVTGDLQNFPVLIHNISSDFYYHAQYDGDDFVFVSADNMTKYNHEIEKYDGASGELIVWVNVTSLSGSDDTVIWMYYGNPSCGSQQNIPGTWDSNFVGVYHMDDYFGTLTDSARHHNMTRHNSPSIVTGVIGDALDFEAGDSDYFDITHSDFYFEGKSNFTIECWVNPETFSDHNNNPRVIVSVWFPFQYLLMTYTQNRFAFNVYDSGSNHLSGYPGKLTNQWYYVTAISTNNNHYILVDGTLEGADTHSDVGSSSAPFRIGWAGSGDYADSKLDEIRVSNIDRSINYVTTTYNNQNEPELFASFGPEDEETNQPPYSPSNPNPPDGTTDVDVNAILSWTCSDPDGDPLMYDVYFEADDPTPDVLVSYHQSQTYYNPPGQMEFNTHYYWKIVAEDEWGATTSGPIWSFTTEVNNPPYPPSNPSPPDGATGVDVNAILSWTCTDPEGHPLTYDVYFEANDPTPDVLVSYHQSQPYYNPPGQMMYNTHYYWRIIAWDSYDASTTGPIWDFTTGDIPNNPPDEPYNPMPEDGATSIDIDADLSWTCSDPDGDDLVYDVYFEANDPDPGVKVSDDQTSTVFDPGTLQYGTDYYWQIIAKDEHGASTAGPIWHFITEEALNEPPNIPTITGPTNGKTGELYEYTFITTDPDGHDICYFVDWGDDTSSGWSDFVESGTEITYKHTWSKDGTYTIKAKAKDTNGLESNWGTLSVSMPRNRAVNNLFLQFLESHPILYQLLLRFLQL